MRIQLSSLAAYAVCCGSFGLFGTTVCMSEEAASSLKVASPLVALALHGPNISSWVLAPIDQRVPVEIRQNVTLLREEVLDEGKLTPIASLDCYRAAHKYCEIVVASLDERNAMLLKAGYRAVQSQVPSPATNQALNSRRNYQMSWPQYYREADQRADLLRVAEEADRQRLKMALQESKREWASRVNAIRPAIDGAYASLRALLRNAGVSVPVKSEFASSAEEPPRSTSEPEVGDSEGLPVLVPANSVNGYPLGEIEKGETIILKYVSGLWKSHGGIATESPDDEKMRYDGKNVLVLAEWSGSPSESGPIIAVVPPGTSRNPFRFTAGETYPNVVLRIHSNSERAENPGQVMYRLTRVPADR